MIVCLEATQIHTPHATCDLSRLFSPCLPWLHSRYLQFTIIPTVAGDHRPPTYRRHTSLKTFPMRLIPSQINSVALQTGMTSLEITVKRHRVLLQIPEAALVAAGMGPRSLGVAFQAPFPSESRTSQVSLLSTTRLARLVAVVGLQGVGVPAVAPLLITLVLLEMLVEGLRIIVVEVRGVGGKDGGIGKR
jgi:hypothetical protein